MGFWKDLQIEQEELGFFTARWADEVCDGCIGDPALAVYVGRLGPIEVCDFCGAVPANGTRLNELFRYMAGCLRAEWDDPANGVGWEGGWVGARVIDTHDLLEELDEPLEHPEVRQAFVDAFQHEWCQLNPYGLLHHDRLRFSWDHFSEMVRTRHRFFFLRQDTIYDDDLVPPAQILDDVRVAIDNASWRLIKKLPAGSPIFRTRAHDENELRTAAALGAPPSNRAASNRMSPAGISLFYGAEDRATAEAEVANQPAPLRTTASWRTTRDLWYLDLTAARPVPSIFDMTAGGDRPWFLFLAAFADDASEPATPGSADVSYVPTQIFTEYVRDVMTAPSTGEAIEAIRFTSSTRPEGACLTVLVGPEGCADPSEPLDGHGPLLVLDIG